MKTRCKEGIEDAYNILFNDCFSSRIDKLESPILNPEEALIRYESAIGKSDSPKLTRRAEALIDFSMRTYPIEHTTPTEIFQLAKKEMKWTAGILIEAIKEAKAYARFILGH